MAGGSLGLWTVGREEEVEGEGEGEGDGEEEVWEGDEEGESSCICEGEHISRHNYVTAPFAHLLQNTYTVCTSAQDIQYN